MNKSHSFWHKVWSCNHQNCRKCCWLFQAVNISDNSLDLWQKHCVWIDKDTGKSIGAHRQAYILFSGTLLLPAISLCHQCHFAPCCNPRHLKPGSRYDNGHDNALCRHGGRSRKPICLPDGRHLSYAEASRAHQRARWVHHYHPSAIQVFSPSPFQDIALNSPRIYDMVDTLRGRFIRLRVGKGGFHVLSMHGMVGYCTLKNFVQGKDVNMDTLRAIETWCDRQEESEPTNDGQC